ncbi:LysR substrate-binding domain-containing protein [Paracidovorax cattleyae]|uniref:LysR substrate-binding domain-containing protein n=1 Tax=Paracidovorax cattleyae TaxID=80868 RepID=UPI0018AFE683|nr:hypothetical protein [Paracidovorax cattleyae]
MERAFAIQFPLTPLRLFVKGLGAGYQPVLDGRCSLGILSALPIASPSLVSERLGEVPLVSVAAADHPLASFGQRIPRRELAKHVQFVLTDRSDLMDRKDFDVMSPSTWRQSTMASRSYWL